LFDYYESTFEERADLVAKLGIKILPSEDLKSRIIQCRLNLGQVNKEREQEGLAKVTFGGAKGIRTPSPFDDFLDLLKHIRTSLLPMNSCQ